MTKQRSVLLLQTIVGHVGRTVGHTENRYDFTEDSWNFCVQLAILRTVGQAEIGLTLWMIIGHVEARWSYREQMALLRAVGHTEDS